MRLGLLADIHEDAERARHAVAALRDRAVDRFVLLGDIYSHGRDLEPVVEVLAGLSPCEGVWGNHDVGLCGPDPVPDVLGHVSPTTAAFFASLRPSLVVEDVFIQHICPHLDPMSIEDLWGGTMHIEQAIAQSDRAFAARSERVLMMGHHHQWVLMTPSARVAWDGRGTVSLAPPERYFLIVGAVFAGAAGVYDTRTGVLEAVEVG